MEKVWYRSYPEGIDHVINPDEYATIVDFLKDRCKTFAKHKAVSNLGSSLTYEQLDEKTYDFAAYLQNGLKLEKGERVAIMLPNCLQYYIAMLGALRAGLVVVNVNPLYTKRELVHQLNDSGAQTLIVMANFAHTVEKALPEVKLENIILTQLGDLLGFPKSMIVNLVVKYLKKIVPPFKLPDAIDFKSALNQGSQSTLEPVAISPEDTAFLQYTGGTTGVAKGAELTHRNIVANVLQILEWIRPTMEEGKEIAIAPLPLYHIFSLTTACFTMLAIGAETVLITNPRDIHGFIKELKHLKFSIFFSINTLCNALLNNPEFAKLDFSHLKFTIVGGMATTAEIAKRWFQATGVHLKEGYGLTETSPVVTINSMFEQSFTGGIGIPIPSTEVDIRDENGQSVPLGTVGELFVRGPQVMKGYWNKPEETAKVLQKDGWIATGDMVTMDEAGLIKVVDRKKDMIIVSGFNVYPNEVEQVLMTHPGILEAAVIGEESPDHTGELVKAVIVKRDPDLKEEDVVAHCKKELTGYKVPHVIQFVEELPKTPVGKILRRLLRKKEEAHPEEFKEAA